MRLALTILFLIVLSGCTSKSRCSRVDGVMKMDSWGRHHGRLLIGPRATFDNGVTAEVLAGYQSSLFWPGEPHQSSRAPSDELQFQVEVGVPLWRRR